MSALAGVGSPPPRLALLAAGCRSGPGSAPAELARRLESGGIEVTSVIEMATASGSGCDPFRIGARVPELEADALVVVASRRWGARRLMPGPTAGGRALALLQADGADDLPPSEAGTDAARRSAGAPWVVAAMGKDVFLRPAGRWLEVLRGAGREVRDLRADRARREDLLAGLAAGPSVVLYGGHGRTRGWGGYQGLREHHLQACGGPAGKSASLIIAFACDTLKRMRSGDPFGRCMVATGTARAYLGAAGPIRTADAEALAERSVAILANRDGMTVSRLLAEIDRAVRDDPAAGRAWKQFRLLGDPTAPITAPWRSGSAPRAVA